MELPEPAANGVVYLCTRQAAELFGVACCTISSWKTKGYLRPLDGSPPRKPMYAYDDLVQAEYTAWQAALRTSGTDKRIARRRANGHEGAT